MVDIFFLGYPMQPPQSLMMPPPIGPNQMGYPPGPSKMGPNMMAAGPMANYNSQYSSQPQGKGSDPKSKK